MRQEIQHAVITGGTGALGSAIADAFRQPGWVIDSPGSQLLDMRAPTAIRRYFHERRVELLVCAAGMIRDAPLIKLSEDVWDETWTINFKGTAACVNAVLPAMMTKGGGHIVLISSYSALHPPIGQVAYATAKAALLGLITDLATRYGPSNIRINAVLPGFLETPMTSTVSDRRRAEILAAHQLGRLNTCLIAAKFVRFLHHEMPHTSGQIFQLDSRPTRL